MPKDGKEFNVVLHNCTKKTEGAGIFKTVGQYAMLTKEDFYRMIEETNKINQANALLLKYMEFLPPTKKKQLQQQVNIINNGKE